MNPSHTYTLQSGSNSTSFPITVSIDDGGCTTSLNTTVQIYPSPVFSVLSTNTSVCPDDGTQSIFLSVVSQQNQSYSYSWSGGVPTIDPSVQEANYSGTYTVTVTNSTNGCISSGSIQLQGCGSGPGGCATGGYNPSFDPIVFNSPDCGSISILNGNVGSAGYFFWDFGDGITNDNTFPDINHVYTVAGIYNVCLNAWDNSGSPNFCDRYCELVEVPLYADFNYNLECGSATQYNVHFHDLSTVLPFIQGNPNAINNWSYSIKGPSPSNNIQTITGQNPTQALSPGVYEITLVITDNHPNSCQKVISNINIPAPPDPTFDISLPISPNTGFCQEQSVVHFNAPNPTGYFSLLWNFNDPDALQNESEYFQIYNSLFPLTAQTDRVFDNSGNHNVQLTVADIYGCTYSLIKSVTIGTNNLSGILSPLNQKVCPGQPAIITYNNSNGPYTNLLWSNNATSNPSISVTTVGQYNVTVTNTATGCTFQPFLFADVGNYNTPQPVIFGELNYCLHEPIVLSGDIGNFAYSWNIGTLTQLVPDLNSANINIDAPTIAGTYPISLTINDMNGCSLVTTVNVVVVDLPPNPVIVTNPTPPLCEGQFYDLDVSASNPGNIYQVNWSTGASTNNISVINANTYQATFTNAAGCSSSASVSVHELPNLDWVVFGCFDYCTTDEINIPGGGDDYSSWNWVVEDINGIYYTMSGSGPVSDLALGMLPAGVYTITLKVEDQLTGCSIVSEPITLTVRTCPCQIIEGVSDKITCLGVDANNIYHYSFAFDVHFNTFPLTGSITITSATYGLGIAVLSNPVITTNPHPISGVITFDPSYHVTSFCVVLTYTDPLDPQNSCTFPYCFRLPECRDLEPCEYAMTNVEIVCNGTDLAGNSIYNLTYTINPPPPLMNAIFSSANGTLSSFPASVNGPGPYSGTFIDTQPVDTKVCIQVNYYNDDPLCFSFACFPLPHCQGDPDKNNSTISNINSQISILALNPNPASDDVVITYALKNSAAGKVTIVDTKGKNVIGINVGSHGEFRQNTNSFQPGIYFVILESANQERIVKKLVIIKN